jgi:hypothetical protein
MTYNKNNINKNKNERIKTLNKQNKNAIKYTPRNILFKRAYYNF